MTSPIPTPHRVLAKLLKWILVSFLIGMLPIALKALFLFVNSQEMSGQKVLGNGELFLVAAGLTASGVGDLIFELRSPGTTVTANVIVQIFRAVAVVMSIAIVLVGAAVYGSGHSGQSATANYMELSWAVLAGAAITSISCVVVSEFS